MHCSSCGHSLMDTKEAFCPKCGAARSTQHGSHQASQEGKGKAIASLILGIGAMTIPIPVLDIILGIVGIVLAVVAKNDGYRGGLQTAGLVCSIIGTVIATIYTITVLSGAVLL